MGRSELDPADRVTARITALVTNKVKTEYLGYCERIGAAPCTRLREFIETELEEDRASKARA